VLQNIFTSQNFNIKGGADMKRMIFLIEKEKLKRFKIAATESDVSMAKILNSFIDEFLEAKMKKA
jgi:hypothetical protein